LKRYKKIAIKNFLDEEYDMALYNFSLVLKDEAEDEEAKIGVLLATLAKTSPEEAQSLYEYYQILKHEDVGERYSTIEEIVSSLEFSEVAIDDIINLSLADKIVVENGITYSEFLYILENSNKDKKALENIFFSTKVIITNKEDYYDFVQTLIDNDFFDIALLYLENLSKIFPNNYKLDKLYEKFRMRDNGN
jgi:hypothetical protein